MIYIEDWSIEQTKTSDCLVGVVYGHPSKPDGTLVQTTNIVSFDVLGRMARTKSGSLYILGRPNEEYVRFCRDNDSIYTDLLEGYLAPQETN